MSTGKVGSYIPAFDLERFKKAQENEFEEALKQIKDGHKTGHWIWYIFPQLKGLGFSENANYYGISGMIEAVVYFNNEQLHDNLITITKALLELNETDILNIVDYPDDLKIRSCMTLFYYTANELSESYASPKKEECLKDRELFKAVIDKYYGGLFDKKTEEMLR